MSGLFTSCRSILRTLPLEVEGAGKLLAEALVTVVVESAHTGGGGTKAGERRGWWGGGSGRGDKGGGWRDQSMKPIQGRQ